MELFWEDSRHGLTPIIGGRDPVVGGVQATHDSRGTLLPGASEGSGAVKGIQGGDGGWIIGGSQDDTAWASSRGEMNLEKLGHWGISADVPHGLPGQGRLAELPGEGMPRTSGDEDGDAVTLYAPACPGHCGHLVVGKNPLPTVTVMQHYGSLAYTVRKAPCHHTV